MKLPNELTRKYRINQVLVNENNFYCAKVFDFNLNKTVLLTVINNIERVVFDAVKNRLLLERKTEACDCILNVFSFEFLDSKSLYYTQEAGEPLFYYIPTLYIGSQNLKDWTNKLGVLLFFKYIHMAIQRNNYHGFISPKTIYYYEGEFKIGDYILGVLFDMDSQMIIESPWFLDGFYSTDLSSIEQDVYSITRFLQFVDLNQYSKVFSINDSFYEQTVFSKKVKEIVDAICANKEYAADNFLIEFESVAKEYNLFKDERFLYRPQNLPLLYNMVSSWNSHYYSDIVVLHINHYLSDIIELNKVLVSMFDTVVYVVVPYSLETEIIPSEQYHTYYHSIIDQEYHIKRDKNVFSKSNSFFDAMCESIECAFLRDIIPLINNGKKVLIIEDGGFHYTVINKLMELYPILKTAIIGTIEQTTSGVKRYKSTSRKSIMPYPVLSVARSKVKMRIESHFIARRVIDELNYLLYMANDFLSFHNVLIIGYGIIGRNIAKSLDVLKCNISIYDIDESIVSLSKEDGFNSFSHPHDIEFIDNLIIIGATGESAFTSSMFFSFVTSQATKIYLASASSKRIEFKSIVSFFEMGYKEEEYKKIINQMDNIKIEQSSYGIIYSFKYKNLNKKIVLIANGYPVNFYRKDIISLTESVIDLVYCEMFLLIKYLLNNSLEPKLYILSSSELNSLDLEEENIVKSWFRLLALHFDEKQGEIWNKFDIHPLEELLRKKCLMIEKEETENEH